MQIDLSFILVYSFVVEPPESVCKLLKLPHYKKDDEVTVL